MLDVTFYCLKVGDKYSSDYVNLLNRNTLGYKLVCVTDDPTGIDTNVDIIPFIPFADKWWNKMMFFNEELFPRRHSIFLDLDLYIRSPYSILYHKTSEHMSLLNCHWDNLVKQKEDTMGMVHKYCSINSSVMIWDKQTNRQRIYDYYIHNKEKIEWLYSGIDSFLEHRFKDNYTLLRDDIATSFYKSPRLGKLPGYSIILFEGNNVQSNKT